MKSTVRLEGFKELDDALAEVSKGTARNILRRAGIKALEPFAETARLLAPDDPETGGNDLRSSIVVGTKLTARQAKLHRKAMKAGEGKALVEVFAGTADPAGVQQEFGNVNHGPQAFMRPAWDQHDDGVLEALKVELGGEIDKAAQRAARKAARLAARSK